MTKPHMESNLEITDILAKLPDLKESRPVFTTRSTSLEHRRKAMDHIKDAHDLGDSYPVDFQEKLWDEEGPGFEFAKFYNAASAESYTRAELCADYLLTKL